MSKVATPADTDIHFSKFGAYAISHNDNDAIAYDRSVLATDKNDINFEEVTKDVINKTLIQTEREKLENKKYNLIIDTTAAGEIISHLIGMLSSSSVRVNVSCLGDKLNKKVFSNKLTVVEEPLNKDYPGYRLFDDGIVGCPGCSN